MEQAVRQRFERIEAILDSVARKQAAAEVRVEEMDVRWERRMQDYERRMQDYERRMQDHERRMSASDARFEKRMHGFQKLVRIGMREIAVIRRLQTETDEKLNALIDAQQRTDATLRAFLDSMRKGGNGGGRRIH
ncbi:MAG TPA: hypothetical protein VJN43_18565 [Bryobacteraceae bacterium]|nr:hypothetical protein [Bryobacteraceae bacterium]